MLYWLLTAAGSVLCAVLLVWTRFPLLVNQNFPFDLYSFIQGFAYFFLEGLVVATFLTYLVFHASLALRSLAYVLSSLYLAIIVTHILSLLFGAELISPLALENIGHIDFLLTPAFLLPIVGVALSAVASIYFMERNVKKTKYKRKRRSKWLLPLVGILFASCGGVFFQTEPSKNRMLQAINLSYTSPIHHFMKSLSLALNHKSNLRELTAAELKSSRELGLNLEADRRNDPTKEKSTKNRQYNIIVFFVEGLSARITALYHSNRSSLTPNLHNIKSELSLIDNYYNHTAASYRGIVGQLCSFFPRDSLLSTRHLLKVRAYAKHCLPQILGDAGFETFFWNAHASHDAKIDELMTTLKFDHVLNAQKIKQELLHGEELALGEALSDHQFFESSIKFLAKRRKNEKPFFLATYNLQTHANFDTKEEGIKFGDGNNNTLNRIHNFDHQFGKFWRYFKNSSFYTNTVLVFTADHAAYSELSFMEAVSRDLDYQGLIIDRIPFAIYHPTERFRTNNNCVFSSIALAPTVLDIVDIDHTSNKTLGRSVFQKPCPIKAAATYAGLPYLIKDGKVMTKANSTGAQLELSLIENLAY